MKFLSNLAPRPHGASFLVLVLFLSLWLTFSFENQAFAQKRNPKAKKEKKREKGSGGIITKPKKGRRTGGDVDFQRNISAFGGFGWAPSVGGSVEAAGGISRVIKDVRSPYDSVSTLIQTPYYLQENNQYASLQLGVTYQPGFFFTGGPFVRIAFPTGASSLTNSYFYTGQKFSPELPHRIDYTARIQRNPLISFGLRGKFYLTKDRRWIPYIPAEFMMVYSSSKITETRKSLFLNGSAATAVQNSKKTAFDFLVGSLGFGMQYNFDYLAVYSLYFEAGATLYEKSTEAASGIVAIDAPNNGNLPNGAWRYNASRMQFFLSVGFQWSFFHH